MFVAVLAGVALLVRRFAPELQKIDWEKKFEAMPDNAPPKWMFRNITAIRDNTDRILKLLEGSSAHDAASGAATESSVAVDADVAGVSEEFSRRARRRRES